MAETRISAQPRDPNASTGKALRRSGYVPAIYYNREGVTRCLQFERNALNMLLRKEIGLLRVDLDGGESLDCIIREVQRHPVRREIIHVDLMGFIKGQKITVHVPVHMIGIAAGIKDGGSLELVFRDLEITCEPINLPSHIDIDVTGLKIHDGVKIGDVQLEGVTFLGDPTATIVHVVPPRTAEAETAVAATAVAAEPEILREKKVEESDKDKDKGKK
jgi:large subunit ribosomal protein L25